MSGLVLRAFPESKLYAPVRDWLSGQGYQVFPECWGHDIVGYKGRHIVTVELKLSMTRTLYFQLIRAAVFSDAVYAAVPSRVRERSIAIYRQHKFGIIRVSSGVEIVLAAPDGDVARSQTQHDEALECLQGWQPPADVIAGLPTLKDCGPAQQCAERVRAYVASNPSAGWKDIYRDVPNHYAHHRSMRGAMPPLEQLKAAHSSRPSPSE